MYKDGLQKEQIQNASRIIEAVDKSLVENMVEITEETCGTCTQIVQGVKKIMTSLEDTLSEAVPEWKTDPIYNTVVMAVNALVSIVPNFCPQQSKLILKADACMTPDQQNQLRQAMQ